jgi:hypothetical protein
MRYLTCGSMMAKLGIPTTETLRQPLMWAPSQPRASLVFSLDAACSQA